MCQTEEGFLLRNLAVVRLLWSNIFPAMGLNSKKEIVMLCWLSIDGLQIYCRAKQCYTMEYVKGGQVNDLA